MISATALRAASAVMPWLARAWAATPSPSMDQTEQDVFGADVVVTQQPRFLLGEDDDPAGPVGEAFEHDSPFQPVAAELDCHSTGVPDFLCCCMIWREVVEDVPAGSGLGVA
jgi:hypothetical protein